MRLLNKNFECFFTGRQPTQVQDELNSYMEVVAKQANELGSLQGEFELLRTELDLRLELSSELEGQVGTLEKKVLAAEDEACAAARKLSNASEENARLAGQVEESNVQIKVGSRKYNLH